MPISLLIYCVLLGLLIILIAGIAYRALFEWEKPGSRTLGFLMFSMLVWASFYLLEISLPSLSLKILSRKILYLGMTMSAPIWLGFALRYTGLNAWWKPRGRIFVLAIPGGIVFLLGLSNESHQLIWRSMNLPASGSFGPLQITYGIVFWVYTAISYTLIAIGILAYLTAYVRSPKTLRKRTGLILAGVFLTVTFNLISLAEIFPLNIDLTPLSFMLSAPLFAVALFRFGLLNLFPIAAPMIIENLHDAVIVVNEQDYVTNINQAGKIWLNIGNEIIGQSVFDILPETNKFKEKWDIPTAKIKVEQKKDGRRFWFEATITRLYKDEKTLLGRVIVVHNITQEQELFDEESHRSAQLGLLEEVGRQIAASFNEKEISQKTIDAVVNRFGYAEAAISLLTDQDALEVTAINGSQDFGYEPGFQQKMGEGIIGHTAKIQTTYLANDISNDPYYFSSDQRQGSAIGVVILRDKSVLGVLYVESANSNAFNKDDIQTLETLANLISASIQRARLYTSAQEHLRIMTAVQSISEVISSSLELDTIFESVVKVLKHSFGYTYISIYFLKEEYLYLGAQLGYPQELVIHKIHVSQGVSGKTIETRKAQFINDITRNPNFLRAASDVTSEICVPLLKENTVLGTLNVEGNINVPLTQADVDMLVTLAGPIALAVDNARLHAQVRALAMTDAVSGLSNRHAFEETLIAEVQRAIRIDSLLSLIIFDVDSFKDYNDKWGHPAGDARLKATADLIRNNLRRYDIAARYGGDEFAIILPNTNKAGSLIFAQRLLAAAHASAPEADVDAKYISGYTLSIGIATFPQDAHSLTSLLLAADQAELTAKRLGKNQIIVAGEK